jgi:ATP-dependent Zn protease
MRASDEVVAYHEAGHAVACVLLGRNLTKVVLGAGRRRGSFEVEEWPPTTREAIEAEIVSLYSGPAAQRIFTGRPVRIAVTATLTVTTRGSQRTVAVHENDGSQIFRLAVRATGFELQAIEELCQQLDAQARELVAVAWPAVELVAHVLLARRQLSGDDVRGFVSQAAPDEREET